MIMLGLTTWTFSGGRIVSWLSWVLLATCLGAAYILVRDHYGRTVVQVDGRDLIVTAKLGAVGKRVRIPTANIDGFWVRCQVDENGPSSDFVLMIDQAGLRSRSLVQVTKLEPGIFLAETLAKDLGVPSDTRGSDLV